MSNHLQIVDRCLDEVLQVTASSSETLLLLQKLKGNDFSLFFFFFLKIPTKIFVI